jgi:hypothetical protein
MIRSGKGNLAGNEQTEHISFESVALGGAVRGRYHLDSQKASRLSHPAGLHVKLEDYWSAIVPRTRKIVDSDLAACREIPRQN